MQFLTHAIPRKKMNKFVFQWQNNSYVLFSSSLCNCNRMQMLTSNFGNYRGPAENGIY